MDFYLQTTPGCYRCSYRGHERRRLWAVVRSRTNGARRKSSSTLPDLHGDDEGIRKMHRGGSTARRARAPGRSRAHDVVVGMGYLPEGRKSPKNAEPRGIPCDRVLAEFAEKIVAMDAAIRTQRRSSGAGFH